MLAVGCGNEAPTAVPPSRAPVSAAPDDAWARRRIAPALLNPEGVRLALWPGDLIAGSGPRGLTLFEGEAQQRPFERVQLSTADARVEVLFFDVRDVGHVVVALRQVGEGRVVIGTLVDPVGREGRPRAIHHELRGGRFAQLSWSFGADGGTRTVEMVLDGADASLVRAETVRQPLADLPRPRFHASAS